MRNFNVIGIALSLLISGSPILAQDISIGPGLFTFPELAARLSTPEVPVHCSNDLVQRAAYVYIKVRPRQQVVNLLSSALELQFQNAAGHDHEVEMRRDPAILARDKKWLFQFALNYRQFLRDQLDTFAPYVGISGDAANEIIKANKARVDQITNLQSELASKGLNSTEQYVRLSNEGTRISEVYMYLSGSPGDPGYAGLRANFPTVNDIEDAIISGHVFHISGMDAAAAEAFNSWQLPYLRPAPRVDPGAYERLAVGVIFVSSGSGFNVEPASMAIPNSRDSPNYQVMFGLPSSRDESRSAVDCAFLGGMSDGVVRFAGLGREAMDWLSNDRKQTAVFLETDLAKKVASNAPVGGNTRREFSQQIQNWSERLDQEAVIELWPLRDHVPKSVNTHAFCLKDMNDGNESPWSINESDGVVILRNRLSFMDRWVNLPIAALVRFTRQVGEKLLEPSSPLPYGALMSYAKDVAASKCVPWETIRLEDGYRGVDGSILDLAVAPMLAIANNPESPDKIIKRAVSELRARRTGGSIRVPMRLSHSIAEIVDYQKRFGFNEAGAYATTYSDTLAAGDLMVTVHADKRDARAFTVRLSFPGLFIHGQAELTWVSQ